MRKLIITIYNFIKRNTDCFIQNINYNPTKRQKYVLISYMDFVSVGWSLQKGVSHTNQLEFYQIIQYFMKQDYVIDICYSNHTFNKRSFIDERYDLIFGFGSAYMEARKRNPNAKCILYMTENPYYISYQREKERIDYLYDRKKIKYKIQRSGVYYKKGDEQNCNAILTLGEKYYYNTEPVPVRRIFPSALKNSDYKGDFTKRHENYFLVLASPGFVHKGMDLVMEIFNRHPEWQLFYCGNYFEKEMRKLHEVRTSNIHNCGFVDIASQRFLKIVEECSAIIHFSCSECSCTSVLTGMRHGLIPIITKGLGFDTLTEYCFISDSFYLQDLENEIMKYLVLPHNEKINYYQKIYDFANKEFTIINYKDKFEISINSILQEFGE